jgi:hypothetical protein
MVTVIRPSRARVRKCNVCQLASPSRGKYLCYLAFCGVALFGLGPNNGKAAQVATRQSPRQGGQALGARKR